MTAWKPTIAERMNKLAGELAEAMDHVRSLYKKHDELVRTVNNDLGQMDKRLERIEARLALVEFRTKKE